MEKQKKTWNKIIGENIRRLRISHNETQAELGESIGYGSTTIANYESGERLPDLITAYAIAQRYHVERKNLRKKTSRIVNTKRIKKNYTYKKE